MSSKGKQKIPKEDRQQIRAMRKNDSDKNVRDPISL